MIAVRDLAYVRYAAPDLDAMQAFLADFGLHLVERTATRLYMRGTGPQPFSHVTELAPNPRSIGIGLVTSDASDIDRLAQSFGATVEDSPEPGGGRRVRLTDPAGFIVDVVHGQRPAEPIATREPVPANPATGRRRLGQTVRTSVAPAQVVGVGHVLLLVPDFAAAMRFYCEILGFRASDSYFAGDPANVIASFLHCGLGEEYTDHHTLALVTAQDGVARIDHSAFEVLDFDDLVQGGEYLKSRGHKHVWGVGRHIEGSQLFDYWRDPAGHKIEHWTDGDLVNDSTPAGLAPFGPQGLSQWGPPLTPEFFS